MKFHLHRIRFVCLKILFSVRGNKHDWFYYAKKIYFYLFYLLTLNGEDCRVNTNLIVSFLWGREVKNEYVFMS
jgi:hypothetical protein